MRKHIVTLRESSFMFALPVVLLGLCLVTTTPHTSGTRNTRTKSGQVPEIAAVTQENVPLRIVTIKTEKATLTTPQVRLVIMNVGAKPITAYAIQHEVITERSRTKGVELSVAASAKSVLQPGQSKETEIGGGVNHPDGINRVLISVDFVEFEDGSTWGTDTHNSSERLAGCRAGARAAVEDLLEVLRAKGPQAVLEIIEAEPPEISQGVNRSQKWLEGFRAGIGFMRGRVKQAYSEGGVSSIESALREPIDASDSR